VTQKGAAVVEGGNRYPYMPWLDFGGVIKPRQEIHRARIKKGRYVWAAFSRRRQEVLDRYMEALREAMRRAGLDVT
jgi:hypothetical protein